MPFACALVSVKSVSDVSGHCAQCSCRFALTLKYTPIIANDSDADGFFALRPDFWSFENFSILIGIESPCIYRVFQILLLRAPSEIACAVVIRIGVDMVDNVTTVWAFAKRDSYKPMHHDVFNMPVAFKPDSKIIACRCPVWLDWLPLKMPRRHCTPSSFIRHVTVNRPYVPHVADLVQAFIALHVTPYFNSHANHLPK